MNKIFLSILMFLSFLYGQKIISVNNFLYKLNHMNKKQYEIYKFVWYNASKVGFSYTLTAIALVESELGLHKMNLADPSCGIFHKLATEYAEQLGMKPNWWNASRLCEKLYENNALSYKVAEQDFLKAYNKWRKKGYSKEIAWKYAIKTYNAGPKWWRKQVRQKAAIYYKNVVNAIKAIKIYRQRRGHENRKVN